MNTSTPKLTIQTFLNPFEIYSDARTHGYDGPSRRARIGRVTPQGGGTIASSADGTRVAVTGKECLRILRVHDHPSTATTPARIDVSRNFWEGSGLKIDSASTDIAWGHGVFNNKLLTSGRNGELIMWDINKSGTTKYERRTKDHIRSIHKMAVSPRVDSYCITGSADGDMRVWDLRDISKSIMRIHHPTSVRSLVFSPSAWQPLEAVVGLDNGSIYRWDLRYGQRGQLDKLPVAHTASVTALDWCYPGAQNSNESNKGMGWLVSGGLDRTVKVWDLTSPVAKAHIPHKPTYTLHPSYGVRRIAWRPGYECELAIVTNLDYPISVLDQAIPESKPGILTRVSSGLGLDALVKGAGSEKGPGSAGTSPQSSFSEPTVSSSLGDAIEIWDVRREWLAKWSVTGSASDGGVTDLHFRDRHALWTQNSSGAFAQLDLREATKPIDAVPRVATTWDATGSLSLVVDDSALNRWEVPYDDVAVNKREPIETRKQQQQQSKYKALGDPAVRMSTQTVATFRPAADAEDDTVDVMTFTNLARRYIFEGRPKAEICAFNAGVALSSGHEIAAQFWLLLGACVSQLVPKPPPPHQHADKHPPASQASSEPQKSAQSQSSTTLGAYSFPGPSSPKSAVMSLEEKSSHFPSHYASTPISRKNTLDGTSASIPSPSRLPTVGNLNSKSSDTLAHGSTIGHFTPLSSARSSPRHISANLPALGPRRLSVVNRRHSVNIGALVSGSPRRPSLPGSHVHSSHAISMTSSPSERTTFPLSSSVASSSHLNSRKENIDEGALDESDSDHNSDEGDGDEESFEGEAGSPDGSSSGEEAQIDPGPMRRRENSFLNARPFTSPSPLRLENRNSWVEDELEDEDDTEVPVRAPSRPKDDDPGYDPSPQQSDEDSETSDDDATGSKLTLAGLAVPSSHIIKPTKKKSRSRSSTVATLSAPPPQALARQQSDSSARTVIASVGGTLPAIPDAHRYDGQVSTDQERSHSQQNRERGSSQHHVKATPGHRRTISQPISAHNLGGLNSSNAARSVSNAPSRQPSTKHKEYATPHYSPEAPSVTERRIEYIGADERRLRETTLAALREALEDFSDRGDIQMCAMVALVAPSDLKISALRVTRFLESYLEILSRLRLDTCAAYIRKYCETEDIRKWTMLETTIYTSCGKCRKPLMLPAGSFKGAAVAKGAFSFCLACKASPMKCSICRLPVRTLLFQCSVCHHGGHQACYTQFYMHSNEMRDLPPKAINDVRGRTWLRATTGSSLSVLTENSGVSGSTASTEDDELSSTVSGTSTEAASTAPGSVPLNTPGNSAYQSPVIRKAQPLFGHPCAAGCGHFCWAASGNPEL